MTRHNERAFDRDNRTSPSAPTDKIYMQYVWISCQEVSQVILSHNPSVLVSVRVCSSAYTHLLKVLNKTQPVKAGQEPLHCIWYPRKVDKVYHCHIFFMRSQTGRGRTNTGRNGGAGRRSFPACYVGSTRRHTEHIQGLCLMLSQFFLCVFFSVALSLKSILLRASADRCYQEGLLL